MNKETVNFPEVGYCKTKNLGLIEAIIKFIGSTKNNRYKLEDFDENKHSGIAWNVHGDKNIAWDSRKGELKFWFTVKKSSLPEVSVNELKELLRDYIINTGFKDSPETIKGCFQTINIKRKQQLKFKFKNIKLTQLCQNSKNNLKIS